MRKAPPDIKVKLTQKMATFLGPNGLNYVTALAMEKTGGKPCRRVHVGDAQKPQGFPVGRRCQWHGRPLFYYVEEIKGKTCVAISFDEGRLKAVHFVEDK